VSAPKAVLLDALGTLVELQPPVDRLRDELRERCAVDVDGATAGAALGAEIAYYRSHLQDGRDAASVAVLRRRCAEVLKEGLGEAAADAPIEPLEAALVAALRFRADPGAAEALTQLRLRGARLVVVSNWDFSLHEVLVSTGLRPLIDGVVVSGEVGVAKPDPAIFALGLELAGASAAEAVHVGDDLTVDVAGAQAAGITPVYVRRPHTPPAPVGVATINAMDELCAAVAALSVP
jgi:putative hydrolase of the HAD superfamily